MTVFRKPAISIPDQIKFLRDKGLFIDDEDRAKRYLTNIGLFRLKPYRKFFYAPGSNNFRPDTRFEDVLGLYRFDRRLRVLAFEALEKIEIAVRSVISNEMCAKLGPHWFMDVGNFESSYDHTGLLNLIRSCTGANNPGKRNPSCSLYYREFSTPTLPPSWVVIEVVGMGTWSRVYPAVKSSKLRKRISDQFGFDKDDFGSWLHALSLIRNICAHHDRLWNRKPRPTANNVAKYTYSGIPLDKPYTHFALLSAFLSKIIRPSSWNEALFNLLEDPAVDIYVAMGFPVDWYELPFWRF